MKNDIFEKAISKLEINAKSYRSLAKRFILLLISEIQIYERANPKKLKIISGKFRLDQSFVEFFMRRRELANIHDEKKKSSEEDYFYNNFNNLKKYTLVHKQSVSLFWRKLRLISINPNQETLLMNNFNALDEYIRIKRLIESKIANIEDVDDMLNLLYLYLYLFHLPQFSISELSRLSLKQSATINDNCLVIWISKLPISNISVESKMYRSTVLDNVASFLWNKITHLSHTTPLRPDQNIINRSISDFCKEHFSVKRSDIASAKKNYFLLTHTSVELTMESRSIHHPTLTLSEIESLFCNTIRPEEIEKEHSLITFSKTHASKSYKEEEDDDVPKNERDYWWSFKELDALHELFSQKLFNDSTKVAHTLALKEIDDYFQQSQELNDKHSEMIFGYIRYLLSFLSGKHPIKLSTVKDYFSTLKNHLFAKVEDLHEPKFSEVESIFNSLEYNNYKNKSIQKIKHVIRRFFRYYEKQGYDIGSILVNYPKSMVFQHEIDLILELIEQNASKKMQRKSLWQNFFYRLQPQALLLIAFYSGLRRQELRTRLMNDIFVIGDEIVIDVNTDGMDKLGLDLKTRNSRRKVVLHPSKDHMKIIKEWHDIRSKNSQKGYAFCDISSTNQLKIHMPIDDKLIDYLSDLIGKITNRYTTFHSLRHSFATYRFIKIMKEKKEFPYALIDLSIEMGHETPQTTLETYIHYDLIKLIKLFEKQ